MKLIQWCKYQLYNLTINIVPKQKLLLFASSSKTKWIRNKFFWKQGLPEIYKKKIHYLQYSLYVSAPLQILKKAETKGIEPSLSRFIMNELSQGDECIDIGANYGFITMIMAEIVDINGHVYSYESDKYIFDILVKNIKDNNFDNICSAENYFISNNNSINTKKIDDLLLEKSKKIKLIKIDTDGSDYNCLSGAENLIIQCKPIIIIEMAKNKNMIHKKLLDLGYLYFYDQHYNKLIDEKYPPNLIASFNRIRN